MRSTMQSRKKGPVVRQQEYIQGGDTRQLHLANLVAGMVNRVSGGLAPQQRPAETLDRTGLFEAHFCHKLAECSIHIRAAA